MIRAVIAVYKKMFYKTYTSTELNLRRLLRRNVVSDSFCESTELWVRLAEESDLSLRSRSGMPPEVCCMAHACIYSGILGSLNDRANPSIINLIFVVRSKLASIPSIMSTLLDNNIAIWLACALFEVILLMSGSRAFTISASSLMVATGIYEADVLLDEAVPEEDAWRAAVEVSWRDDLWRRAWKDLGGATRKRRECPMRRYSCRLWSFVFFLVASLRLLDSKETSLLPVFGTWCGSNELDTVGSTLCALEVLISTESAQALIALSTYHSPWNTTWKYLNQFQDDWCGCAIRFDVVFLGMNFISIRALDEELHVTFARAWSCFRFL